jgi:hypothetical protein
LAKAFVGNDVQTLFGPRLQTMKGNVLVKQLNCDGFSGLSTSRLTIRHGFGKILSASPSKYVGFFDCAKTRRRTQLMSEQVQSIVEAVRSLDSQQRQELTTALLALDVLPPAVTTGRKHLVEAIKGKYRHIPTSSEEFINRKWVDVALESQP